MTIVFVLDPKSEKLVEAEKESQCALDHYMHAKDCKENEELPKEHKDMALTLAKVHHAKALRAYYQCVSVHPF